MAQYVPAFRPGETVTFDVTTAVVAGRYVEVGSADRSVAPAGAVSLKVVGVAGHDAAVGDKVTVETGKPIDLIPCAAAVARGARVESAAAGKCQTRTTGQDVGLALNTTTAADQLVYVLRS